MLRALEGEAWRFSAMIKGSTAMDRPLPLGERLWRPLESTYLRLEASNYSETLRKMVAELKGTNPCLADPSALDRRAKGSIAWWNFLGRIAIRGGLVRAWLSARDTALEAELTQRVLAAR